MGRGKGGCGVDLAEEEVVGYEAWGFPLLLFCRAVLWMNGWVGLGGVLGRMGVGYRGRGAGGS